MSGQPSVEGVAAILRRVAATPRGYALDVDLAAREVDVTEWWAELVLPDGATVAAGPGTTVEPQGQLVKLRDDEQIIPTGSKGSALAAVTGTPNAPTHVRVHVATTNETGNAHVDGLFVQDKRGRLHSATESTWPGSTTSVTDPDAWTHGGGSGGGGGGGGQFECDLLVDFANQTVRHQIRTDAGGGGGAGGGGTTSGEYDYHQHQKTSRGVG